MLCHPSQNRAWYVGYHLDYSLLVLRRGGFQLKVVPGHEVVVAVGVVAAVHTLMCWFVGSVRVKRQGETIICPTLFAGSWACSPSK